MQNLAEYLASEQAREDGRLLIHASVGYLRVGHGTWNLGSDGAWKTATYHANATQQDHTVYYRLDGERYVVTDLGEGVRALRLRTGRDTPTIYHLPLGTLGQSVSFGGDGCVSAAYSVSAADLPNAICKVMLASLRVMTL